MSFTIHYEVKSQNEDNMSQFNTEKYRLFVSFAEQLKLFFLNHCLKKYNKT